MRGHAEFHDDLDHVVAGEVSTLRGYDRFQGSLLQQPLHFSGIDRVACETVQFPAVDLLDLSRTNVIHEAPETLSLVWFLGRSDIGVGFDKFVIILPEKAEVRFVLIFDGRDLSVLLIGTLPEVYS
ncbi:MAG: hypothetical protein PHZ00_01265 [Candidatus Peribacteraceae bacterium]|nr:hypothetical protein [Candidatus Peribacteraceae bacterium]